MKDSGEKEEEEDWENGGKVDFETGRRSKERER